MVPGLVCDHGLDYNTAAVRSRLSNGELLLEINVTISNKHNTPTHTHIYVVAPCTGHARVLVVHVYTCGTYLEPSGFRDLECIQGAREPFRWRRVFRYKKLTV